MKKNKFFLFWIGLILFSFLVRFFYLSQIQEASGGDAYEFLLIGRRILNFQNPFLEVKRLPVYPLFLLPGHLPQIDGVVWGRLVSSFFASTSIAIFYLINKRLGIKDLVNYISVYLFSINPVFFIFSLRPLSYTLYTFLFLTVIYLVIIVIKKKANLFYLGIALGLLAMTRHEGFLVAAIVFSYFLYHYRKNIKKIYSSVGVFILITLPFYVHNFLYYSNPLHISYLGQGGLYRPSNLNQLFENFEKVMKAVFFLWGKIPFISNYQILTYFPLILVMLGFFGVVLFFHQYSKQRLLIFILLLAHLLVALWFQPSSRYLQQSIPFIALFTALGLWFFISPLLKRNQLIFKAGGVVLVVLILLATSFVSWKTVTAKIRESNIDTTEQHAFTEAVKFLVNKEGKVALEPDFDYTRSYIAMYYLGSPRIYFLGGDFLGRNIIPHEPEKQWSEIKENDIDYIIDYEPSDLFSFIGMKEYEDKLNPVKTEFDLEGEEVAKVYEVIGN